MDEVLLNQLKEYKKFQSSKYIPVRGDEITTRVFEFDKYYVSTKIDGHLCFIYKKNKDVCLYNFNGKSFNRKELISEALKKYQLVVHYLLVKYIIIIKEKEQDHLT